MPRKKSNQTALYATIVRPHLLDGPGTDAVAQDVAHSVRFNDALHERGYPLFNTESGFLPPDLAAELNPLVANADRPRALRPRHHQLIWPPCHPTARHHRFRPPRRVRPCCCPSHCR